MTPSEAFEYAVLTVLGIAVGIWVARLVFGVDLLPPFRRDDE